MLQIFFNEWIIDGALASIGHFENSELWCITFIKTALYTIQKIQIVELFDENKSSVKNAYRKFRGSPNRPFLFVPKLKRILK